MVREEMALFSFATFLRYHPKEGLVFFYHVSFLVIKIVLFIMKKLAKNGKKISKKW